jgi:hypothetical protein
MVLWTVLPLDLILEGLEKPPVYEEMDYEGTLLMVERLSPEACRVVRLLATDPSAYLRPEFQPGAVIGFRPAAAAG